MPCGDGRDAGDSCGDADGNDGDGYDADGYDGWPAQELFHASPRLFLGLTNTSVALHCLACSALLGQIWNSEGRFLFIPPDLQINCPGFFLRVSSGNMHRVRTELCTLSAIFWKCSISVHASMQSGECSVCVVLEASEVVWLTCLARILHFTQRRMQRLVCALCSVCGLGGGECIRGGLVGVFGGHCASKCLQSDAHCSV